MLSRRAFVTTLPVLPLALLASKPAGAEETPHRGAAYRVDGRALFGLFPFHLEGRIEEEIDRTAGRYRVKGAGQGPEMSNGLESAGIIRGGRFVPSATLFSLNLWGHKSRTAITYDHARGLIAYDHLSHTFWLNRRREIHDVIRPPAEHSVDDAVTAALNYAEGALTPDRTGAFRIFLVWRTREASPPPGAGQGAGDRAAILPVEFRVLRDPLSGRDVVDLDLSRFSSWARRSHPARIAFGPDRLPDSIQADLLLGSSVRVRLQPARGFAAREEESTPVRARG